MKSYENVLNKEEKEWVYYYHWELGTLFEDEYYQDLIKANGELEQCYLKTLKENCDIFNVNYDKYLKGEFEFNDDLFDEFLLSHMQLLNELLEIGLYK